MASLDPPPAKYRPPWTSTRARRVAQVLLVVLLTALAGDRASDAQEAAVPIGLQAELLAKVAEYDRNFRARAGPRAHVLILTRPGSVDSARFASQMEAALGRIDQIAGLPHDESIATYSSAPALATECRNRRLAIVYVGPGFRDTELESIRAALDGVNVLSVAALPQYVPQGVVLGFDLVSGRPKLVFHLTQARKQHVDLRAEVLKLMKVYE